MQVTISATSIGNNAGPFAIYQNFDSFTTPVITGVTRNQILSGYVVTIDDATTIVRLTSSGICTNSTDISVTNPSISPTPTTTPTTTPTQTPTLTPTNTPTPNPTSTNTPTPSPTPASNRIDWSYTNQGTTTAAALTITLNGSPVVTTAVNGASGNFSYNIGDTIVVSSGPNNKVTSYTTVCVLDNFDLLFSDQKVDDTAQVTFTAGGGRYEIFGAQSSVTPQGCPTP